MGICLTANSRRHRNPDNGGGANGSQHHLHAPITANRSVRHSRTVSDENESRGVGGGGTGRRNHASGRRKILSKKSILLKFNFGPKNGGSE